MNQLRQDISIQQSQQLVMTPELRQAISLLQMSNLELSEYLEQEIQTNPLLEKADGIEQHQTAIDTPSGDDINPADDPPDDFDSAWNDDPDEYHATPNDTSLGVVGPGGRSNFDNDAPSFETFLADEQDIRDKLIDQINIAFGDPGARMVAHTLFGQLDESGYLSADLDKVADQLGTTRDFVDAVVDVLRQMEPAGLFARDLADCLRLQLIDRGLLDDPMAKLIDHLDLLGQHDMKKLEKICGVNKDELADMIETVRRLNPKPGNDFAHIVTQTRIPDVHMRRSKQGGGDRWVVQLNRDTLPRLIVNRDYKATLERDNLDKEAKKYLSDRLQSASWLIKALDQRAQTILAVSSEIIRQQDAFFAYGIQYLKPMTLKDVAEKADVHESTVSRVTTNKYMATPRGIFELKYFFNSAIKSASGTTEYSSESVKALIQGFIDDETVTEVLSDNDLVNKLSDKNIDIARRTVAKYRKALKIPSSTQRRRKLKADNYMDS